jgi:hypothetical protein
VAVFRYIRATGRHKAGATSWVKLSIVVL